MTPEIETPAARQIWPQRLLFLLLATALPATIVFSCMWLMATTYTDSFNLHGFLLQYGSGIYRYRLLGRDALLWTYHALLLYVKEKPFPLPQEANAQFVFYTAFVVLNGCFFFLSNLVLLGLLWIKREGFRDAELSAYFFYTLLLTLSMAVVTPYDQMAYFFILVGLFALKTMPRIAGVVLFAASVILGALTRETEMLAGSVLATVALCGNRKRARQWWFLLALHLVLFSGVYLWLRIHLPGEINVIAQVNLGGSSRARFLTTPLYPLLFAASVLLVLRMRNEMKPALVLFAMSAPYLVTILVSGIYTELRLMVPILLGLLCVYILMRDEDACAAN
jgi:hypothetical protein